MTTAELRAQLRLGVVAVVGAGLSLGARYPDTLGLNALMWDAIDSDPDARAELAGRLGRPDAPAKALVGDRDDTWAEAWQLIEASQPARNRFQSGFVNLDLARSDQPSASHDGLARLIHAGIVECVISFNWDSSLERAYERLYGTRVPEGTLHKPHGDVADPTARWVLPHESGVVPTTVAQRVKELVVQHPRTLLVVGYSESDEGVVEELIKPLEERWRVSRIGPSATGPTDVTGTADEVLLELSALQAAAEDAAAWRPVTFTGHRSIEAALAGRRMQPADADACPPLPEVDIVDAALRSTHAVVINGDSGSGKSITAYQSLRGLAREGYEVLTLRDRAREAGLAAWKYDLKHFPHRKVLFVDDAQDLSADVIRELAETATSERLVLVVGVDHVAAGVVTVPISNTSAVATMETYVRSNRADLLPLIRVLDDRVGDSVVDEPFDERLASAAREPSAWQFFFNLTGGWRRIARTIHEVREHDRADLVALALAVAQIAGVDAGVPVTDLEPYAAALGRDRAWIHRGLATLEARQVAVQSDGRWRCAHMRAAHAIIRWLTHPPTWPTPPASPRPQPTAIASATHFPNPAPAGHGSSRPIGPTNNRPASRVGQPHANATPPLPAHTVQQDRDDVATAMKTALNLPTTSMRGIAWLLKSNSSDGDRMWRQLGVRTVERDQALTLRALSTPVGPDTVMAAQLLVALTWPDDSNVTSAIWSHLDVIRDWVHAVTPANGWAIADLVNHLSNHDRDRIGRALDDCDPHTLATLIPAGGWSHIYSTTRAVDRITQACGKNMMAAVGEAFNEQALRDMLTEHPPLYSADDLFETLAYLNQDLGIRLFEEFAEAMAADFSIDPLDGQIALWKTLTFLLGYNFGLMRHRRPTTAQRRAMRAFLRALDVKSLAATLSHPAQNRRWFNFSDFLYRFHEADPVQLNIVASQVNLEAVLAVLDAELPEPGSNTLTVLIMLAASREAEVHAALDQREPALRKMNGLSTLLVDTHPALAVSLLRSGLRLDLKLDHQYYSDATATVAALATVDPQVACEVAIANTEGFVVGLAARVHPPFTDLRVWVEACDELVPGFVESTLEQLPAGAVASWMDALRLPASKDEIAGLVLRASAIVGHVGEEADSLIRRFPSLKRRQN